MTAGGHTRLPRPDSRLCRTYTSPWSLSANSAQAHLTLAPPRTGFDANLTLEPAAGSEPLCRTHTSPWALSGNSAEAHLTLALPWTGFDANLTLVPSFGSEPRCATVVPERDVSAACLRMSGSPCRSVRGALFRGPSSQNVTPGDIQTPQKLPTSGRAAVQEPASSLATPAKRLAESVTDTPPSRVPHRLGSRAR